jgi:hypothetical protein
MKKVNVPVFAVGTAWELRWFFRGDAPGKASVLFAFTPCN